MANTPPSGMAASWPRLRETLDRARHRVDAGREHQPVEADGAAAFEANRSRGGVDAGAALVNDADSVPAMQLVIGTGDVREAEFSAHHEV
jgi:hypothetical protein